MNLSTHSQLEHTATDAQLAARKSLMDLYCSSPLAVEDRLFNIGLYARSGVLVKFLVMADLYQRFLSVPGILVEFGTWFGQNLILLENLRAIYEPFAKQRRIVGFDTFEGYVGEPEKKGWYSTGKEYKAYLAKLLKTHQRMNVYGHQNFDHELVEGQVQKTVPEYFKDKPHLTVAFAFFDIGPYEPTVVAMRAIKPHLLTGSILVLDEFTWEKETGEATAFRQVFKSGEYKIEKCSLYPSKAIVTIL